MKAHIVIAPLTREKIYKILWQSSNINEGYIFTTKLGYEIRSYNVPECRTDTLFVKWDNIYEDEIYIPSKECLENFLINIKLRDDKDTLEEIPVEIIKAINKRSWRVIIA